MTMLQRILALAILGVVLAGCGPVSIRTAPAAAQACDEALATGKLVKSAQSGLAIAGPTGAVTEVLWPYGYSARTEGGRVALLDQTGTVVAREGDTISMGGGLGANNTWAACAGTISVVPPS